MTDPVIVHTGGWTTTFRGPGLRYPGVLLWLAVMAAGTVQAAEWTGPLAVESRMFFNSGQPEQDRATISVAFEPEFSHAWNGDRDVVSASVLGRLDSADTKRSHVDLRQFDWLHAMGSWEWRIGVRRVYWGVVESQHLVDIINQTDWVENLNGEDKLGQPMVNAAWISGPFTFDAFVMTGFRERTHPGVGGRPRFPLRIADSATYDSAAEIWRTDVAGRMQMQLGVLDLGLAHFAGTSREPRYVFGLTAGVLTPHYDVINQSSLDAQVTTGGWLLKLESIYRQGMADPYTAVSGGAEYTLYTVLGTKIDVGLLAEGHWDERGDLATTPLNRDVFVGSRLALNDRSGAQCLAGATFDVKRNAQSFLVEASANLGDRWKLSLEGVGYHVSSRQDFTYGFRKDSSIQAELEFFL